MAEWNLRYRQVAFDLRIAFDAVKGLQRMRSAVNYGRGSDLVCPLVSIASALLTPS